MDFTGAPNVSLWRRFWERGGWWRALLVVAAYFVLYQGSALLLAPLIMSTDGSVAGVWVGYVLPIAIGGLIIAAFAWSTGWLGELFGKQPIRGKRWMWIAVTVVLVFNVLHFAAIDYAESGGGIVVAWLAAGLVIGFAEETLTRGLVVNLMRKAGHREIVVAVVSAALFAAMHAGNLLSGQPLVTTLLQLVYTFAFGICMYLTLRVTGNLVWPVLLHATTDPSIFLFAQFPTEGALAAVAALGNPIVILTGLVLFAFIRGRVGSPPGMATIPPVSSMQGPQ